MPPITVLGALRLPDSSCANNPEIEGSEWGVQGQAWAKAKPSRAWICFIFISVCWLCIFWLWRVAGVDVLKALDDFRPLWGHPCYCCVHEDVPKESVQICQQPNSVNRDSWVCRKCWTGKTVLCNGYDMYLAVVLVLGLYVLQLVDSVQDLVLCALELCWNATEQGLCSTKSLMRYFQSILNSSVTAVKPLSQELWRIRPSSRTSITVTLERMTDTKPFSGTLLMHLYGLKQNHRIVE